MRFRNLDETTRHYMEKEVQNDIATGTLYLGRRLSERGKLDYPPLLLDAVTGGTPQSLARFLGQSNRLNHTETNKLGVVKKVPYNAAEMLAEGEFNRFYIRAVCLRAIEEGNGMVRVYRAKQVRQPRPQSVSLLGTDIDAEELLTDLRASPGVDTALGLPGGPNSGLSVSLHH